MKTYNFAIPVKIDFVVDESLIEIETIEDLEKLQEDFDVDLSYIIDKCELNILNEELEDDYDEDDDYYAMPTEDIFQDIISENWDDIINKLNKEYKLKDFEESQIKKIFDFVSNDFKNNIKNEPIKDFEIISYNTLKSEFVITLQTDKNLNSEEIEDIRSWLDVYTTDKWGDDISKKDLSGMLESENHSIFLIPWSIKKDVKYIK